MRSAAILLALAVPLAASANGFAPLMLTDEGESCYTWSGGNFSAGAFSKCSPTIQVSVVTPAPLAAPPPNPVMVPMSCPPLPQPHHKPIVRRKPRVQC